MVLNRRVKKRIFVAGMLFIPVVHFVIFWVAVNFNSILLAFQRFDRDLGKNYFTLANFKDIPALFVEFGPMRVALGNTFMMWSFNVFFLLPWAFLITYFLYKKIALHKFWRTTLFLPGLIPGVAMTSIFIYIIYPDAPVGKFLGLFTGGNPPELLGMKYARYTVILYNFLLHFGGSFVLLSGAMARVPKEVLESAQLDGADMRIELFRIILPLCWPTISMLLLMNVSGLFTASGPVLLLTNGNANTTTVSFWIFNSTRGNQVYMPAAVGLIFTVILFPIVLLTRWGLGKVYADVDF